MPKRCKFKLKDERDWAERKDGNLVPRPNVGRNRPVKPGPVESVWSKVTVFTAVTVGEAISISKW